MKRILRKAKNKILDLPFIRLFTAVKLDEVITLDETKVECPVCKRNIEELKNKHGEREVYFTKCPKCSKLYCFFCFDTISSLPDQNQCWNCDSKLDPNKPFIAEKKEDEPIPVNEKEEKIEIINDGKK